MSKGKGIRMPTVKIIDITKQVRRAREAATQARLEMFAAFAQLQLDVQATHQHNWDSLSVRQLEEKIDSFKASCQAFRKAEDRIIVAMSLGDDRFDSAVPSPAELGSAPIPSGAAWEEAIGVGVVEDLPPENDK